MAARRSKIASLEEAMAHIRPGLSLLIGGMLFHNRPAALVREIVRRRIGDITLFSSPQSAWDTDLLVGVGLVTRSYTPYVGFEYLGMAPNYRAALESGRIDSVMCEAATLVAGLKATIEGIPYHPIGSLVGTDIVDSSPMLKRYTGPFGHELVAVQALKPDVGIFHAQEADEYGNIRHLGSAFMDNCVAKASGTVIVTVDKIISHEEILKDPHRTTVPGFLVDMVVEVPYGAHPCASHLNYNFDEDHFIEYLHAARESATGRDPQPFREYLEKYVYQPESQTDYLERVGGEARLSVLREEVRTDV